MKWFYKAFINKKKILCHRSICLKNFIKIMYKYMRHELMYVCIILWWKLDLSLEFVKFNKKFRLLVLCIQFYSKMFSCFFFDTFYFISIFYVVWNYKITLYIVCFIKIIQWCQRLFGCWVSHILSVEVRYWAVSKGRQ